MISEKVFHGYGNIFDFYCEVHLFRNIAKVWRETALHMFTYQNGEPTIHVKPDFDEYDLIKRGRKYYLRNSKGEEEEIGERYAQQLVVNAILEWLGKDFYFDGREDNVKVDMRSGHIELFEVPRTIKIFNYEGKFYINPEYKTMWIQKTDEGYKLCTKDWPEGLEISESSAEYRIQKALLSDEWKKEIFIFPDRE